MDSMIGSAKATGNIVAAGMKSPLDFTMSLAQGFRNAPKLYGDKTIRPVERVTGFQSGLKAAGKEFGLGFYDGLTGLVTQPLEGAKEEGLAGLGKGLFRGAMGLVLKPGAAMWGLPGYTMKGIYAEIIKNFGKSTSNFIIAARTAQGYEDWKSSSEGERERIVKIWKSSAIQTKANKSKWGKKPRDSRDSQGRAERTDRFRDENGQLLKGFSATRHLSYNERQELHKLRQEEKEKEKGKSKSGSTEPSTDSPSSTRGTSDDEVEYAIRTAVQQTSRNDPEEDARIERAIRASVKEFSRNMGAASEQHMTADDEDNAYNRAVAASVAEYQRRPQHSTDQESGTITASLRSHEDDEQLMRALAASLEESRRRQAHDEGLGSDTEDDEEYRRAVKESKQPRYTGRQQLPSEQPPEYSEIPGSSATQSHTISRKPVGKLSEQKAGSTQNSSSLTTQTSNTNDEELHRALQESEDHAKQQEVELEKQRREEETVLEYVKKQSLAEEEYKRKMQSG